LQHF